MFLFAIWHKLEGWMNRSKLFVELKEQRSGNVMLGQDTPSAFRVSSVGSVDRKNSINGHQVGL